MISYERALEKGASRAETDHTAAYAEAARGIVAWLFRMPFEEYSVGGDHGPALRLAGDEPEVDIEDEERIGWDSSRGTYHAMLTYAAASAALELPRYKRPALVDALRKEETQMIRKSADQAYTDLYLSAPRVTEPLRKDAFRVGAEKILEADSARLLALPAFQESVRWIAGRFVTDSVIAANRVQTLYDSVLGSLHPAPLQELRTTRFADFEQLLLL